MRLAGVLGLVAGAVLFVVACVVGLLAMQMQERLDNRSGLQSVADQWNGQDGQEESTIEGLSLVAAVLGMGSVASGILGMVLLVVSFLTPAHGGSPPLQQAPVRVPLAPTNGGHAEGSAPHT